MEALDHGSNVKLNFGLQLQIPDQQVHRQASLAPQSLKAPTSLKNIFATFDSKTDHLNSAHVSHQLLCNDFFNRCNYTVSQKNIPNIFHCNLVKIFPTQLAIQVVQKQMMGEVETERSFDGKLCQKYSYQKLSKSDNWFSSYGQKCPGCFFETQWAISLFDLDFR